MNQYKIGDHVECIHDADWQNKHRESDTRKRQKLGACKGGLSFHCFYGNAAAYMHLDEAYVVTEITETGGLRLSGFTLQVSPNDVQHSTKKCIDE